jgi:hypothetical protein
MSLNRLADGIRDQLNLSPLQLAISSVGIKQGLLLLTASTPRRVLTDFFIFLFSFKKKKRAI